MALQTLLLLQGLQLGVGRGHWLQPLPNPCSGSTLLTNHQEVSHEALQSIGLLSGRHVPSPFDSEESPLSVPVPIVLALF